MVNFNDPARLVRDFCAYGRCPSRDLRFDQPVCVFTATVVKLWHTVDGLFMWVCSVIQVSGHHRRILPLYSQLGVYYYP